uniref:Uncharacterized protein n=1 Tax=Craspedostauros australis TaxID=1486917 RepID=A0A7S0F739_9STRA|mmetsp:Transcript_9522/g.25902  ORF Transcript_9522/g.25902 Transcript_9522/m.25902 type:complete len:325 (+) Transcript_9522:580-1554(+)|eukprot:CAMPEP_0198117936 /NCGR_PEP_ID=MMETSP1442-20131203/19767_1 /TAXON_ID= /ORGANISM="Craspedostauros australis, Strain CCMP3328" /LENGTH=324 /DNA_ID=CAMNT_0043776095 /DNA_START=619 /DNA_END=1593 /DNA_ORIENTATION=-
MASIIRPVTPSPASSPMNEVAFDGHDMVESNAVSFTPDGIIHRRDFGASSIFVDTSSTNYGWGTTDHMSNEFEDFDAEDDDDDGFPIPRRVFSFDEWAEPTNSHDNDLNEDGAKNGHDDSDDDFHGVDFEHNFRDDGATVNYHNDARLLDGDEGVRDEPPQDPRLPKFFSFSDWEQRDTSLYRHQRSTFTLYQRPTSIQRLASPISCEPSLALNQCPSIPRLFPLRLVEEDAPLFDGNHMNSAKDDCGRHHGNDQGCVSFEDCATNVLPAVPLMPRAVHVPCELGVDRQQRRSSRTKSRSKLLRFRSFLRKLQTGNRVRNSKQR